MSEPIILTFDYKERGQETTREIEFEIISPEHYENGKKALKIYSNLLDIADKWKGKARFESYKLMKEAGYTPTAQFFNDIDVSFDPNKNYTDQEKAILDAKLKIKGEVEYILNVAPSFDSQMYYEIYEYLVENLFLFVFKDLQIEWTNPSVPFLQIAKAYYSVWQNVFFGNVRDTSQNLKNESKEEKENSDVKIQTNTPKESDQKDQMTTSNLEQVETKPLEM
jgi:hypothetical protein